MAVVEVARSQTAAERMKEINEAYSAGKADERARSNKKWKRIARRLKSKYKHMYEIELAKRHATQDALIAMIRELSDALQGQVEIVDEGWTESTPEPQKGKGN